MTLCGNMLWPEFGIGIPRRCADDDDDDAAAAGAFVTD